MREDPLIGQLIGSYRVKCLLGEGGMGAVYHAVHLRLDREVALKILPPHLIRGDRCFLERFFVEARAAARVDHPNIVRVYDADEADGVHYIAMEYVRGSDLKVLMERRSPLSESEAVEIVLQAAKGLEAAACEKIIHRDIKPANLMLMPDGRVKVADFGLAKNIGAASDITQSGQVVGTPAYMSPEQAEGEPADLRSDIYSLGITFFEMVTGVLPFWAETPLAFLRKQVEAPLPDPLALNSELHPVVVPVLTRMTAKKPADRYLSYEELIKDLLNLKRQLCRTTETLPANPTQTLSNLLVHLPQQKGPPPSHVEKEVATRSTEAPTSAVESPSELSRPSRATLLLTVVFVLSAGVAVALILALSTPDPARDGEGGAEYRDLIARAESARVEALSRDRPADWIAAVEAARRALDAKNTPEARELLVLARAQHAFALAKEARKKGDLDEAIRLARQAFDTGGTVRGLETFLSELQSTKAARVSAAEKRKAFQRLRRKAEGLEVSDPDEAKEAWKEALAYAASEEDARLALSAIKRVGGLAARRKAEQDRSERMSASLKAVARALAARREGRLEKAREFYQDALDKVPGFIEAEKGLAEVTYIIGMGQGEKAEKSGDWFQARNAYRFALEARRGDPSARARLDWVNMHLAELARRFQGVFLVPDGKEDPFGNPVVRRNGASSDPVSGLPTELWLVDPLMEFVLIPAGSFSMGSPADENGRHPNEGPVHPVSLARPFYIGKYEVTQVQWKALMNRNPSTQTGDRHPVENVSWEDCLAFTARLDQRLRKVRPRLHPGLPSEAEWEYACRAGSSTLYCNGDTTESLARVAWYFGTAEGRTHPVGLLKPNAWGLYDVHGNVYEWTMDGHHNDYRGAPADGAPWNGVGHPGIRMLRGGAARATARQCRSAYRWILNGSDRADDKGLRIVLRTGSK